MSLSQVLFSRGVELHRANRLQDALTNYDQALALNPNHPEALYRRGVILWALNRSQEALASTNRALALRPQFVEALYNRAVMLRQLGHHDKALASLNEALKINPRHVDALINRAHIFQSSHRSEEALLDVKTALEIRPDSAELLNSYGTILQGLCRYEEALSCFDAAIIINPRDAGLFYNRANVLREMRRLDNSLQSYDRAIALRPDFVEAYNNRGAILKSQYQIAEALKNFEAIAALEDRSAKTLINCGGLLQDLQRHEEALVKFKSAFAVAPDNPDATGGLIASALHLCDWDSSEKSIAPLRHHISEGTIAINPFVLLGFCGEPETQQKCAEQYVRRSLPHVPRPLWDGPIYHHDKIRLVYLSPDFCPHPVAHQIVQMLERHDRSRFEVIALSIGPDDGSDIRARIERAVDSFVDGCSQSDWDVAHLLRRMEADIIVDLCGHTRHARTAILSYRPAPIQVNYLGYAGTMGADFFDYVIGDRITLPVEHQCFYSERIVRLPNSYHVANSERPLGYCKHSRSEAGLPEKAFVFCCFNGSWKISRPVFDVWMRLLRSVPGSVLWLKHANQTVKGNLRREAQSCGVDGQRIVFATEAKTDEHLARHQLADLFLDTGPFNGHSTAIDSLWAGLPLITCRGQAFAGRVAASLLHAVGLSELVTNSLTEFESLALRLANDQPLLESIRIRLQRNRVTCPLFDIDQFCGHIENAFVRMVEIAADGRVPSSFDVA